jgi:hypothetical protein
MCTETCTDDEQPRDFDPFYFIIDCLPDEKMVLFNIPAFMMFRAGKEVGFSKIRSVRQYCDPNAEDNPIIRKYLDEYKPCDYVIKFKLAQP